MVQNLHIVTYFLKQCDRENRILSDDLWFDFVHHSSVFRNSFLTLEVHYDVTIHLYTTIQFSYIISIFVSTIKHEIHVSISASSQINDSLQLM